MEIWKTIPNFEKYEVSDTGFVRNKSTGLILSRTECTTTKGSYLVTPLRRSNGKRYWGPIHRYVLMAHSEPQVFKTDLDVNHLDGDKHNNNLNNLEWSTRSNNVIHAFDNGLNEHVMQVEMLDIETNEVTHFRSNNAVGEFFQMTKSHGKHIVQGHRSIPYRGRYLFKNVGNYKKQNLKNLREVYVINLHKGEFHRLEGLSQTFHMTGLTIRDTRYRLTINRVEPVNGYIFAYVENLNSLFKALEVITQEDVIRSIEDYKEIKLFPRHNEGWLYKDYASGKVKEIAYTKDLAKLLNIALSRLQGKLRLKNELKLIKGYSFKRKNDDRDFPIFTSEEITLSLKQRIT